ncbi:MULTISPECIES: alpha-amylase family glycosyl hydrolase [unclassified Microbulbifer]|uniref:alpha-amylase family protein n=1 Tax=unclassified Microbulbifer TaxID=2619833 RepID=UPI0027E3BDF9|nr:MULTISPECIES: alpha-amylase family glycosyl hydrolase [unclassified Microbulbifer]
MKKFQSLFAAILLIATMACTEKTAETPPPGPRSSSSATDNAELEPSAKGKELRGPGIVEKPVIYQVLPRLFGNTNPTNKPWGTIAENGVGKFNDFTPEVLADIRELGATHIWYTGVLHHALIGDYSEYGITGDDPDVVKGRAGSPYAVKDYYSVNPDLAEDPAKRLEEFRTLVERSHDQSLKVIIDIVPNHVARGYQSQHKPEGVRNFGADDDTSVAYARDNNFYYVTGENFKVPEARDGYRPLGGEAHPLADGKFPERPAKWTGNGARTAQPQQDDWYETVKINYGVRPDGSEDFPQLPKGFSGRGYRDHAEFWADKEVPDSWKKFRDIAHYWLDFGVDGFRYDVAELVPVEFWSYLNASIKQRRPDALLLAEIYQPELYRDFIQLGKMDYLYDKVGSYDAIRAVMEGKGSTDKLVETQAGLLDIAPHMLHFMENHDEQRIASPQFAGNAKAGKPAMLVSATISAAPTLVYFGQELGEPALEDAGFGKASRTTIFDYWSVPSVRRWLEGQSTGEELELRNFYQRLLNFSAHSEALRGGYMEIHSYNRKHNPGYDDRLFAFARWNDSERLLVIANFDGAARELDLKLPGELLRQWQLKDGSHTLVDQLDSTAQATPVAGNKTGKITLQLQPYASHIFRIN